MAYGRQTDATEGPEKDSFDSNSISTKMPIQFNEESKTFQQIMIEQINTPI